jgi:hypothetical protein
MSSVHFGQLAWQFKSVRRQSCHAILGGTSTDSSPRDALFESGDLDDPSAVVGSLCGLCWLTARTEVPTSCSALSVPWGRAFSLSSERGKRQPINARSPQRVAAIDAAAPSRPCAIA